MREIKVTLGEMRAMVTSGASVCFLSGVLSGVGNAAVATLGHPFIAGALAFVTAASVSVFVHHSFTLWALKRAVAQEGTDHAE